MTGTLFVIEGVDGSGKATQTELLYQALLQQQKNVRKVSFPDYDSPSSSLIKMYLNGEFGTDPQSVNAFATSVFFAVDRFASFRKDWQAFYEAGIRPASWIAGKKRSSIYTGCPSWNTISLACPVPTV